MPLIPATLQAGLVSILQIDQPSLEAAAEDWADVAANYFTQVIGPIASDHSSARDAFRDRFVAEFSTNSDAHDPTLRKLAECFSVYAFDLVATANNPPTDTVVAPPALPIYSIGTQMTAEAFALEVATKTDLWARTGLVIPPTGSAIPWA